MFSPNKSAQSFLEGLIILKQSCSSNLEEIHIAEKNQNVSISLNTAAKSPITLDGPASLETQRFSELREHFHCETSGVELCTVKLKHPGEVKNSPVTGRSDVHVIR